MIPCSIDDERLRQAFPKPPERAEPGVSCPADETLWDAAHGDLDPERAQTLLEHAAGCASCQESLRAAREIAAAAQEALRPAASPSPPPGTRNGLSRSAGRLPRAGGWLGSGRRPRTWVGVGLAAAAAVALFVVIAPFGLKESGSRFRDAGGPAIASLVVDGKPLPREAFVLRWKGGPPGEIYTVEIALEDLTVIHRAEELERGEYQVPASVLEKLPSGTVLLWRVEALLRDTTRVSSPVFRAVLE